MFHDATSGHQVVATRGAQRSPQQYEWRVLEFPRTTSHSQVRTMMTEHAEYGRWELARSQILVGGQRRIWLRRRVYKLQRTDVY
ncbi:DUF5703 family protein [Demequina sediminicola]|uniref:DUF5703 family protein n=1 Tax=Demequina sediminicola TaxID=1095026 RepID=UPI000B035D61|nr:DUF5703 family protein [Demequina sediminicola]